MAMPDGIVKKEDGAGWSCVLPLEVMRSLYMHEGFFSRPVILALGVYTRSHMPWLVSLVIGKEGEFMVDSKECTLLSKGVTTMLG